MARFGEVLTAMVTPFADDGSLDTEAAGELARWLVDHGSDGLVVAGTTGESPTLSDDEKLDLWRAVREAVTVPVIAGAGSNDTRHSVELTERASALGVDAILAVAPYYNRPSQAGFAAHFRALAAATDLPVLIYDIPVRTGRKVSSETLVELASEVANLAGVKDAAGDPGESARVIASTPDTFEYYSGDDSLTLPLLAVGAVGVIGVATHWSGLQHGEMIKAFRKGDIAAARDANARLIPSFRFETSEVAPNPIPAKAMMRTLGLTVGQCRLPMGPEPGGLEDEARRVLQALEQS
jgi:4-hydroxy-tetrahydrodipicolinate synthase